MAEKVLRDCPSLFRRNIFSNKEFGSLVCVKVCFQSVLKTHMRPSPRKALPSRICTITQGIVSEAPLDLLSSPTTRNTKKNVELVHEFPFLLFFLTLLFEQVLGFLRDPWCPTRLSSYQEHFSDCGYWVLFFNKIYMQYFLMLFNILSIVPEQWTTSWRMIRVCDGKLRPALPAARVYITSVLLCTCFPFERIFSVFYCTRYAYETRLFSFLAGCRAVSCFRFCSLGPTLCSVLSLFHSGTKSACVQTKEYSHSCA